MHLELYLAGWKFYNTKIIYSELKQIDNPRTLELNSKLDISNRWSVVYKLLSGIHKMVLMNSLLLMKP